MAYTNLLGLWLRLIYLIVQTWYDRKYQTTQGQTYVSNNTYAEKEEVWLP